MSKVLVEVSAKNNVRAGLDAARADLNKWKKETEGGLKLERDSKVKRNVLGLASDLGSATSGTDALAAAGNRLSDVFQNKLKTALAIGFGVQILQWASEGSKEFANLTRQTEELTSALANLATMESGQLKSAMASSRQAGKEFANEVRQDSYDWLNLKQGFTLLTTGQDIGQAKFDRQIAAQQAELLSAQELVARQKESADILEMRVRGENEAADALERQLKHQREIKDISPNAAPGSKKALREQSDRIFNAETTLIAQKENAKAMKAQGGVVAGSLQEAGGGGRAMSFFAGDAGQILREQLAVAQQVLYAIRSLSPGGAATSANIPVRSFDLKK